MGFIGHALIDFSYGWGIWWSWVIASGVFGLLVGLSAKLLKEQDKALNAFRKANKKTEVTVLAQWTNLLNGMAVQIPYGQIAALEAEIEACGKEMSACGSDYVRLQQLTERQEELERQLEEKTERWLYLTELKERIEELERESDMYMRFWEEVEYQMRELRQEYLS